MRLIRSLPFLILLSTARAVLAAPAPAPAAAEAKPAERCEAAVADTIREMRGKEARDIEFIAAQRSLLPATGDETTVKGAGRYKTAATGVHGFTYRCAYNAESNETSGVVFRETGSSRPLAEKAWEPDLSKVSPDACETAIAATLKDKYPRVGRIAFDAETRRLQPAPNEDTWLDGQGAVERAPGMNSIPFTYRCAFQARTGRLVGAQATP
ncbi:MULTISPECIES: hypothetical protein [unclassified Rhizobacter]|uniref:hypothetical protein n=1 Tax=unclassified Rhizobacter TaxID=2640088 RepID=UPI0006FDB1A2|nr:MULTISPECIES: hypothetical protein [unclassified Rhizobacter]KQW13842.1 hypothetical protein ASC98_17220 [Rhizobacter sp. Root1238]KRB20374.1 hypothetical protein ASE08_22255 [Rhizobacter sp. Root16D2]